MSVPDLTNELSFEDVDDSSVDCLVGNGVVVFKNVLDLSTESGVVQAYHAARRRMLHRRLAARGVAMLGLGETTIYRRVQARDIKADPNTLPSHKLSARPAIESILDIHKKVAEHPKITDRYKDLNLNLALFALSLTSEAFPLHQDNQGATGVAYAAQFRPTLWKIHHPPSITTEFRDSPVAYSFETEPSDVVALTEREGRRPMQSPRFRAGEEYYHIDGSIIHSGTNMSSGPRYGLSLFNEQIAERMI